MTYRAKCHGKRLAADWRYRMRLRKRRSLTIVIGLGRMWVKYKDGELREVQDPEAVVELTP